MPENVLQLGILVSGRGSNLQAILDAISNKTLKAQVNVVLSNRGEALALKRAEKYGVPAEVILAQKGESKESYDQKLSAALDKYKVDMVVLAGFMRILSPHFINHYPNRILNIHPSLLPAFKGLEAQKQALDYGVRYSGCTVHLVDTGCDTGPIILQAVVPVLANDTLDSLSERILKEEHRLLPKAIDLFAKNKVKISGRHVNIMGEPS